MLTKKELNTLRHIAVGSKKLLSLAAEGHNCIIRAEKAEINGQNVLHLSVTAVCPVKYSDKPEKWTTAEAFLMSDGYTTKLSMTDGKKKWSSAFHALLKDPAFAFKKDKNLAERWLGFFAGRDRKQTLYSYEEHIRSTKRLERERLKQTELQKTMSDFPAVVPSEEFAENLYRENAYYFIKQGVGYCTACKQESPSRGISPKTENAVCPCCGTAVQPKYDGWGRKKLIDVRWSANLSMTDGDIYIQYFRHIRRLTDYRNPEYHTAELIRTRMSGIDFLCAESWETPDYEDRWRKYMTRSWNHPETAYNTPLDDVTFINQDAIKDIVAGDDRLKYSALELYAASRPWGFSTETYIYGISTHPEQEKLVKAGFSKLALAGQGLNIHLRAHLLDTSRTELHKIMQISMVAYRLLARDAETVTPEFLYAVQEFERLFHRDLQGEEFGLVKTLYRKFSYGALSIYSHIEGKGIPFRKALKYLKKQNRDLSPAIYWDYLQFLEDLQIPLTEFTKFPKDLKAMHDQRAKEVWEKKDEISVRKAAEADRKLKALKAELYEDLQEVTGSSLQSNGYIVRLPESLSELDREGAELHHCVATYKKKVETGQTSIFFIRKSDDPDKPFYTLEWKDGHIVQCHGLHNCDPTPDVKALCEVFTKTMHRKNLCAVI